ncbi:hypothetical protein RFX60_13215, partial [Acinetobacter sp. 11520]|nr:hypothetical protein [Acinetobacter sp. 11520]
NIQNILHKKKFLYLKVTKTASENRNSIYEHTLHLPVEKTEPLLEWLEDNLLSSLDQTNFAVVSDLSNEPPFIDNKFIRNLHSS